MSRFTYDRVSIALPGFVSVGFALTMGFVATLYSEATHHDVGWIFVEIALAAGMVLVVVPLFLICVFRYGDVVLTDDGIRTLAFGLKINDIHWNIVTSVYKINFFDTNTGKDRFEYLIVADKRLICVDDYINQRTKFLNCLNRYISEHRLPAYIIDRSIKTRSGKFAAGLVGQTNNLLPRAGEAKTPVTSF